MAENNDKSDSPSDSPSDSSRDSLIEQRRDYTADTLRRQDLEVSPVDQFTHWLKDARSRKIIDATAMIVSTADSSGQPHSRVVLLKEFDETGFVWYTYQESNKAREIAENNQASILFYWCLLERQVRIEGTVERLNPKDADTYFYSRPEGSRFSAAASIQSAPVENRAVLEAKVADLHKQYPEGDVPRPSVWGGYRLKPHRFEFWQGRADRLHDRFIYTQESETAANEWQVQRLSP